ncbi:SDR family NAD(P)-dependent oxidoreductase [Streptomyces mexicanus]|uniref:SDR family NAD(P)-dependent oxidoreductase n=1 Tax=Streptomyces mexicanus TaxID=178566 RepID=UPI0031ECBC02
MRYPRGRNAEKAEALLARAEEAPGGLSVLELDVLSEESAAAAVEEVVQQAGGLDVVVHNAAHLLLGVTEAFSPEEVVRAFDVNAVGALRVNRAVLPVMRRQESGLLLWIGSGTTRAVPPFLAPYTAAKAAFDAFAESTAWEVTALRHRDHDPDARRLHPRHRTLRQRGLPRRHRAHGRVQQDRALPGLHG